MSATVGWIEIGQKGIVSAQRILAVGGAQPAGMKRLLGAVSQERIVDLTGGRRRQSLLVLDSTHVVITALPVEEIGCLLKAVSDETSGSIEENEEGAGADAPRHSIEGEV